MTNELTEYINKEVVIDTKTFYVYLGVLKEVGEEFLVLENVDVHDHTSLPKSKELYILESVKYGIKANRRRTRLVQREMISISLLSEVIEF